MDRSSDRSHVLKLPKWLIFLRGAQLLVALLVFCLACYGAATYALDGDSLSLFTGLATFILLIYIVGSELWFPQLYNYWAILGLEIFAVFFWLVSFAILASEISGGICFGCWDYWYKKKRGLAKRSTDNFFNAMATEAAFGGVDFALFVISLVFVSIQLYRHRKEGGHCHPGSLQIAPPPTVQTVQAATQWPAPNPPVQGEQVQNVQMQTHESTVIPRAELPQEGQQMYQQPAQPRAQYGYNALPVPGVDDAYFDNP